MAVTFDSDGEYLSITTGLFDYNAAYTICGWVYPQADDVGAHGMFIPAKGTDANNADKLYIAGTDFYMTSYAGGSGSGQAIVTRALNTWQFGALVRTSATSLIAYVGTTVSSALTTNVSARAAMDKLWIGNHQNTQTAELNGRMESVKVWTAALTADELKIEMNVLGRQVRQADKWAFWPMVAPG